MPTSERSLTADERLQFKNDSAAGMQMIAEVPCTKPSLLCSAVDTFIQSRHRPIASVLAPVEEFDHAQVARALGTVWGNQLVREFGWEWIVIMLGAEEHYVVARPDRALVIFAHEYVQACLDSKSVDCKLAMSCEMLREGAIESRDALSYTNAMKLVTRTHGRHEPIAAFIRRLGAQRLASERHDKCRDCALV